ncbi:MAG TPA: ATP-binding protein [Candidatus Saccharimonadales bacterium]|nr:ATP-binding protein [Candidatus Saccharimonadales bacterium]
MSIRIKLTILMLLIGLVPTLIVSAIAYITISSGLTRKTAEQLVSTAIKQEQRINGLLQKRQEEAIELSNKFDLQRTLGMYLTNKQAKEQLSAILLAKKIATPDIQTIHLADLKGKIIVSTNRDVEGTQLDPQDFALAAGQEISTGVRKDQRDGIDKLYITAKVNVNKTESGVVSVVFRIDDIIAALQDYTGLGTTGETVVAEKTQDGTVVSLFPLRFDADAPQKTNVSSLQLFAPAGQQDYKELTDYRGKQVMVAAKSIGFADWVIAAKIDTSEALAQIDQLRNLLFIIVLTSSGAIVLIALGLTRFFTQPILQIATIARRIGRGDFLARTFVRRNDEIGMLAESINAMGISLDTFVTSIESQRNRLEVILNSTKEGILAIDKQGMIVLVNQAAAEMARLDSDKLVGKNINDIFAWTQQGQPFTADYAPANSAVYEDLEFTNVAGATSYVKLIVARVSGEQEQKAAQTIVTIHDETRDRELEAMKVDFVSMAAHELRTPLAAIRGYLELITFKGGQGVASDDTSKYLQQALKSSTELGGLINNLLDVTRIERGTLTFNLENVDIAADVKQAVEEATFSARDKKITVVYQGATEGCFVIADRIALHEVINNLISNAIKYTPEGGKVSVLLGVQGADYRVQVTDTGVGIPKQSQSNLFTKFYRVHGGLDSGSTGTGLGLFIAKSLIERQGGTITFSSEEGKGSTFIITLPKADTITPSAPQSKVTAIRRQHGWTTQNITR